MGENSELNNAIKFTEYVECEIPSDLALVEAVVEKLRAFCQRNGLPPRLWSNIELATVEGLNNAIVHGCAGAPDASVRLRWSWEQNAFEIQILDPGDFQPGQEIPTLPDDPLAESGRGRFLIATMMDEVEDRITEGKTSARFAQASRGQNPAP